MSLDLILRQGRLTGSDPALVDIGVSAGRIVDIAARIDADAAEEQLDGRLVIAGFVETHIHLDKSCILERCNCERGTLEEAIETVAAAKRAFTEADIHARAQRTLEKAIIQGTTRMRTHVEADPRVGLNGFHAVRALKRDYAWALDLEICVFPQEGLTNDPGTEELLVEACEQGADVIGGCPYTDTDPAAQTARIFAIARRFDLDIDFHLDFDLDPSWMHLDEVCRQTDAHRWGGRVAIGHVTKLSTIDHSRLDKIAARLADAGVAVTVLPATDLFLMGREHQHHVPRGVAPAHRLLNSWRDLLARDQQRAQSVHAVRRLLAHPHGEPLCQYRAARPRRRHARLLRHGHHAAGAAHECRRLRHRSRSSRRPRGHRQPRSGDGGGRARATAVRLQARPTQLHPRRRDDPSSGRVIAAPARSASCR